MTVRFPAGLALAAMMMSGVGWNTAMAIPAPGNVGVPCTSSTLDGLGIGQTCTIQFNGSATDKDITILSNTLPVGTIIQFTFINNILVVGFQGINAPGEADYALSYTIGVNNPAYQIVRVDLDSDVQPQDPLGTTVTKNIYDSAIGGNFLGSTVSTDGSQGVSVLFAGQDLIRVDETFHIANDQTLLNASNAFFQTQVPEPASLGILGAGLLGLGMIRRRKA